MSKSELKRKALQDDCISRKAAIDALRDATFDFEACEIVLKQLPSAHPVHNTTLEDVLTYIDGLDEEHWQELVSCLECRGLTLESHSHSWCGQGGFA